MKRLAVLTILALILAAAATAVWHRPEPRGDKPQALQQPIRSQSISFPAQPLIRVNVTPKSRNRVAIAIAGPYAIRDLKHGRFLGRYELLKSTFAVATARGIRIGDKDYAASSLEIVPHKSPSIWVGDHQYRGKLRLIRRTGKSLLAVNVVALEDYVASVVNGETPATFPLEARKAQAIVARTYALFEASQRVSVPFDVYADARSQEYPGFQYRTRDGRRLAGENAQSRRIAKSTMGLVCTHQGRLFHTYYSAVCGGRTLRGTEVFSDAGRPFHSVECHWCRAAKRYRWKTTVDAATLSKALQKFLSSGNRRFGSLRSIRRNSPSALGRMDRFTVSDGRRRYQLTGAEVRSLLGASRLPSSRFDIRLSGSKAWFEGRGHGHGVGMCQWGAAGLAKSGRSAAAILRHYYRGIRIVKFESPVENRAARTAKRIEAGQPDGR